MFKPVVLVEEGYRIAHTPLCFLWQFFIRAGSTIDKSGPKATGDDVCTDDEDLERFECGLSTLSQIDVSQPQGCHVALEAVKGFAVFMFTYLILPCMYCPHCRQGIDLTSSRLI